MKKHKRRITEKMYREWADLEKLPVPDTWDSFTRKLTTEETSIKEDVLKRHIRSFRGLRSKRHGWVLAVNTALAVILVTILFVQGIIPIPWEPHQTTTEPTSTTISESVDETAHRFISDRDLTAFRGSEMQFSITLPSSFSDPAIGEQLRARNELSIRNGLDFSPYLGQPIVVWVCGIDQSGTGVITADYEVVLLIADNQVIGFWEICDPATNGYLFMYSLSETAMEEMLKDSPPEINYHRLIDNLINESAMQIRFEGLDLETTRDKVFLILNELLNRTETDYEKHPAAEIYILKQPVHFSDPNMEAVVDYEFSSDHRFSRGTYTFTTASIDELNKLYLAIHEQLLPYVQSEFFTSALDEHTLNSLFNLDQNSAFIHDGRPTNTWNAFNFQSLSASNRITVQLQQEEVNGQTVYRFAISAIVGR